MIACPHGDFVLSTMGKNINNVRIIMDKTSNIVYMY